MIQLFKVMGHFVAKMEVRYAYHELNRRRVIYLETISPRQLLYWRRLRECKTSHIPNIHTCSLL